MPHPASSGTGYFHVSAWIQMFGEAKAWEFMDRLHDNIAVYEHSGTRPCRLAAAGEFPLGISYELAAASARQKGAPIDGLMMKEGGGWDMDAAAILRGTKKPEAARRLMDFAASRKANELYASFVSQVAMPGIASHIPDYPAGRRRIDDQERLRLGLGEPHPHPGGMGAPLRRQGGEEELNGSGRSSARRAGRPTNPCRSSQFAARSTG